jgi:hypothetical protein
MIESNQATQIVIPGFYGVAWRYRGRRSRVIPACARARCVRIACDCARTHCACRVCLAVPASAAGGACVRVCVRAAHALQLAVRVRKPAAVRTCICAPGSSSWSVHGSVCVCDRVLARKCARLRACVRACVNVHIMCTHHVPTERHTHTHARGAVDQTAEARGPVLKFISRYDKITACLPQHRCRRDRSEFRCSAGGRVAHRSVILDAHVSRSNTSGSVPPMLALNLLIVHVGAAQSVAHAKVYVSTLKLPTARRCADHTRARGSLRTARKAMRWRTDRAACASSQRRRTQRGTGKPHLERPSASPLQATTSALHARRSARWRRLRALLLQHDACGKRKATCDVASNRAQLTRW